MWLRPADSHAGGTAIYDVSSLCLSGGNANVGDWMELQQKKKQQPPVGMELLLSECCPRQ